MALFLRYPLAQHNVQYSPFVSLKRPSQANCSFCLPFFSLSSPVLHRRFLLLTSASAASASGALESPSSDPEATPHRTRLIAQNVPWTSTLDDVRCLFERYGTVTDIELSMHNKTRNRGLAFVTMGTEEEALEALNNLDSYEFEGRVIKVEFARVVKKKASASPPKKAITGYNLFVGNLTWGVKSSDLRELFGAPNDEILSAEVVYQTNPRRPAGYGFISFVSKEAAEAAITAFNGKKLMGRAIRLGFSKSQVTDTEVEIKERTGGQNL